MSWSEALEKQTLGEHTFWMFFWLIFAVLGVLYVWHELQQDKRDWFDIIFVGMFTLVNFLGFIMHVLGIIHYI